MDQRVEAFPGDVRRTKTAALELGPPSLAVAGCVLAGKTMDERIDAFLKDVQELEGVPASAIRDGVRIAR